MSAGRPTKYRVEYCKLLLDHMRDGLSYQSFAGVVEICIETLYQWEREYPEFLDAKRRGLQLSLLWDERLLNRGSEGKQRGYNAAAHRWKMTNRYKWTERQEIVSKAPSDMTLEELKAEARQLLDSSDELEK